MVVVEDVLVVGPKLSVALAKGKSIVTSSRSMVVFFGTSIKRFSSVCIETALSAAGMMLCIIPGIIVAITLSVSVPVAVEEKPGVFASLRRSGELTKGYRDQIFGVFFVIGAINIALAFGFNMLAYVSPSASLVLNAIREVLNTGISATASAFIYYQLRSVKESLDLDELASVFD